jgi:glycerol-3-phosphate acyltransferase PlsY
LSSQAFVTLAIGFFLGAIPFGWLLFRLTDKSDIRAMGSGNIGACNVLRTKGIGYGMLILFLDTAKGALPLWYASQHFPGQRPFWALTILVVTLGHIHTPFLKGKGGKGVATFFGGLIVFSPWLSLIFLIAFLLTVWGCRYVSAASVSAVSLTFMAMLFSESAEVSMLILLSLLLITVQHRQNIQRILNGQENRLGRGTGHESS